MNLSAFNKSPCILLLLSLLAFPSFAQSPEKMTVLTFAITDRSIADDSLFLKRMRKDITHRLSADLNMPLRAPLQDLKISNNQLTISLNQNTDAALIIKRLTRAIDLGFYGGYADPKEMTGRMKQEVPAGLLNFPPEQVTSPTYLATFIAKDSGAVRKMLKQIGQPIGHHWYFHPDKENIVELYLLHTAAPAISSNEVTEVSQYEEHWSDPEHSEGQENKMQCVMIVLNPPGAVKFAAFTRAHQRQMLAIVTGNQVIVAPIIQGEIDGGRLTINSGYDPAITKAVINQIGYPFPCKLTLLRNNTE